MDYLLLNKYRGKKIQYSILFLIFRACGVGTALLAHQVNNILFKWRKEDTLAPGD